MHPTLESFYQSEIIETLAPKEKIAVFDADGTLWDTDVGELFLQFMIKKNLIRDRSSGDAWDFYLSKRWGGEADFAIDWIARQCAGLGWKEARTIAQDAFQECESAFPYFSEIRQLIQFLQNHAFQIYVVSASPKVAVEPAATHLGIKEENVIGLRLKEKNGEFQDELVQPRSVGSGKVLALLEATRDLKPFIAAGNTLSDLGLLEISKMPIAVRSASPKTKIYAGEQELMKIAKKRQWLHIDLAKKIETSGFRKT